MKAINEAKLEFWSRSANEGFARTTAACFAAQLDPTLDEINDIKTAVSEAVTNCIVHAYPDELGMVKLRLRLLEDSIIEITVTTVEGKVLNSNLKVTREDMDMVEELRKMG